MEFAAKIEFRGKTFAYTYIAKTLFECEIYIDSFRLPVQNFGKTERPGGRSKIKFCLVFGGDDGVVTAHLCQWGYANVDVANRRVLAGNAEDADSG